MSSAKIVLVLAAGPRLGKSVGERFASDGYKVALASRSVSDGWSPEGYLNIKLDLTDREVIPKVFEAVEASLGLPNIVIYNGARRELTPPDDPLSAPFETIEACRKIGLDGAYIAAQESLRGFRALPDSSPKAFIFTGNALSQIAIPGVMPFALGKVAAAMLIEYAANAYGKVGYRFYYADERQPDGRPAAEGLDGAAHGEMYLQLAAEEKQSKWLVTFTKGQGRKDWIGLDFDGNTRAKHDEMLVLLVLPAKLGTCPSNDGILCTQLSKELSMFFILNTHDSTTLSPHGRSFLAARRVRGTARSVNLDALESLVALACARRPVVNTGLIKAVSSYDWPPSSLKPVFALTHIDNIVLQIHHPTLAKQAFITLLAIVTTLIGTRSTTTAQPYPNIADTSDANSSAIDFFGGYFTAKSQHNASGWLSYFHPTQVVYYDATLGEGFPNRSSLVGTFTALADSWPKNATSYPLQILGSTNSAVVHYVDTPGLFGAEIRAVSGFDFKDGKVTRQVDYWDGRRSPVIKARPTTAQYPVNLGVKTVVGTANHEMTSMAQQLNAAFASGNASAAASLFTYDAIFRAVTLRARLEGQLEISRHLQRVLASLPYGKGAVIRHVLGGPHGGGYEWKTGDQTLNGITGLELDGSGLISGLTTAWDGSRISDHAIQALAGLVLET